MSATTLTRTYDSGLTVNRDKIHNTAMSLADQLTKAKVKGKLRKKGARPKHNLSPAKAKEILHDGTAHGIPITDKQRRFFGAVSNGKG